MIDPNTLEEQCPMCNGKSEIRDSAWYRNWATRNSKSQILDVKDRLKKIRNADPDQPDEAVFLFCRNCHGSGKILTEEGKRLMEFVRFWLNPNY